jgi:hypothetical protein
MTTALVSACHQSYVDMVAMSNQNDTSDMDMRKTPSPNLAFLVMRAREDLGTELSKRKERSVSSLIQTGRCACAASRSSAWTVASEHGRSVT